MTPAQIKVKETFEFLAANAVKLSLGQLDLVKGMQKYYRRHKTLSERQKAILFEIRKYLNISDV